MIRSGIAVVLAVVWLFSCTKGDTPHTVYYPVDSLIQAQSDRLTAAAGLFKALGGGWAGGA